MNINEVIKFPILSEKTYSQMQNNVYTFAVDKKTNKIEIRKTIEFIFEVKVEKVNIINYDKKPKRVGKYSGYTNAIKKAIVYLKEGKINIFPDEVESNKEMISNPVNLGSDIPLQNNIESTDIEKKAAEKIAKKIAEKEEKNSKSIEVKKDNIDGKNNKI